MVYCCLKIFGNHFLDGFVTSLLVLFFCRIFAFVELIEKGHLMIKKMGNSNYHKFKGKMIFSRQQISIALDITFVAVMSFFLLLCKIQFGYQARKTAIPFNNIHDELLNNAALSSLV